MIELNNSTKSKMRHFFKSNSWLEPSFDLILHEPFGEIENHHINRQRMQRHFPSPFSLFTNEYNLEPKLNKKSVHNHLPQVSDVFVRPFDRSLQSDGLKLLSEVSPLKWSSPRSRSTSERMFFGMTCHSQ